MIVADSVHSILSPSGADRWGSCLGALAACKGLPEQRTNEAAALGTAKHAVSERRLGGTLTALGTKVEADGHKFEVDEEFLEHVQTYVEYCDSRPGTKQYEVRLSTAHVMGVAGQGGTSDCVHRDFTIREIEIIDAKFGYIPVGADHKQLRWYGAAALALYDLEADWATVRCTIVQPQDKSEPVKSEVYTRTQIEEFVLVEAPKAQTAHALWLSPPKDLLKHLTPSDAACAWCPIAGSCIARANRITNMFDDVTAVTPDVVLLSDKKIAELLLQINDIAQWAKSIEAEAQSRALLGRQIPEHKLIYGRKGRRSWMDGQEEAIASTLSVALGEDAMYLPRKLLSPTMVEDALKAVGAKGIYKSVAPFVTQADGRLTLVPVTHKGDPVFVAPVSFEKVS